MPKYLVEIILIVKAKNPDEARKIADYIIDLLIPDKNIENAIETMRYEELSKSKTQEPKLCPNCPLISLLPIITATESTIHVKSNRLLPTRFASNSESPMA